MPETPSHSNTATSADSLPLNPLTLYRAGRESSAQIAGLSQRLFLGFLVNLSLFLLLAGGLSFALYFFAFRPAESWMKSWLPDSMDWIATLMAWGLPLAGLLFSATFAVRVSVALMSVWFENLVERVVEHHRPGWSGDSATNWLAEITRTTGKELLYLLLTLAVGFVPLIGAVLVFIVSAMLMGRAISGPYREVLKSRGESPERLPGDQLGTRPFVHGIAQMGLLLVPVVGWFALPWFLTHAVIGRAELGERMLERSV